MPVISNRGHKMPPSPIRKLVPFANQAKAKGIKVFHLNIGQPDISSPQVGLDALRNIDRTILEYSPSEGHLSLREKLSQYYRKIDIRVDPGEIIITTGGSEAILFSLLSCLDPGDEIIVPEPAYANYWAFALSAGVVIRPVTSRIEDGFALPPVEEFEKIITSKTRGILICNPNNPTGYVYTREEMGKIRDLVKKYDLFLFSDEVYREFCYTGAKAVSALHLEGIDENVVLFDSVSKRYSECGIRIGAVVTRNSKVWQTVMKSCQARLSPPLLGQIVAEASLGVDEDYLLENHREYMERRNFLIEGLNRIPGVFSPLPMGAFYTVARLPVDDADRFATWLLSDFQSDGQTVFIAPASGFYATPGCGINEARIAYVLNRQDLASSLRILEEALKVYPGIV
jgi:aspartate aminotransferase